jgi:predicted GIY-YIG superfamily endonuclease
MAADIIFVGDPDDTVDGLLLALKKGDQYSLTSMEILETLGNQHTSDGPNVPQVPVIHFRQRITKLPEKDTLVVYMLASLPDPSVTYVGMTGNIRKRINQHNSASGGSKGTDPNRGNGPWGLFMMIVGFESRREAMSIEGKWKASIATEQVESRGQMTTEQKANLVLRHITNPGRIRIMRCADLIPSAH